MGTCALRQSWYKVRLGFRNINSKSAGKWCMFDQLTFTFTNAGQHKVVGHTRSIEHFIV